MATGHGSRGWTDGRARQAQAASGELRAGIEGAWLTRMEGWARGYKQGWADGLADGPNRAKITCSVILLVYLYTL